MTDFEQEFDAALEDDPRTGDVFVVAPFSVADTYGTKETLPVATAIDGFPYRGELTAIGDGYHALVIPREVRRAVDRDLPRGAQQLPLDLNGLAPGAYYCQVREARRTGSRIVVIE